MKKFYILASLMLGSAMAVANSPYASKVYEFAPAPGQFINELPETDESTTAEELLRLVEEQICGAKMPGMISLGGWGGYVVFSFDHPVINVAGEYDFKIYGNAVLSNEDRTGGSCEPGIVMVSMDENGDGLPNDTWYQIAGSAYSDPKTIHNYSLTYYKPAADASDDNYIRWTDSEGASGFIPRNTYHRQSYWPLWMNEESMTFSGERLPDNAIDVAGDGKNFVLMKFDYGYVDNLPNNDDPGFKLDWAVDSEGQPVNLPKADFFKVYTGENQSCGWIGETSTEVSGAEDLHPDAVDNGVKNTIAHVADIKIAGRIMAVSALSDALEIYSCSGVRVLRYCGESGIIDLSNLPSGIYIVKTGVQILKIVL